MSALFSVETVFFTVLGYSISYLEFIGTGFYLWSVWLIAKRHTLTWPVGIVSVLLFMGLFYQIRLYSAAFEQVYYLIACSFGWWYWWRSKPQGGKVANVGFGSGKTILCWLGVTLAVSVLWGSLMTRAHGWLPSVFPEVAAYPYIDALTTIASFAAMWLMVRKQTEAWVYWIAVDLISIWLYFVKGVPFLSLLYVILLILAVRGLMEWVSIRIGNQTQAQRVAGAAN